MQTVPNTGINWLSYMGIDKVATGNLNSRTLHIFNSRFILTTKLEAFFLSCDKGMGKVKVGYK